MAQWGWGGTRFLLLIFLGPSQFPKLGACLPSGAGETACHIFSHCWCLSCTPKEHSLPETPPQTQDTPQEAQSLGELSFPPPTQQIPKDQDFLLLSA